MQSHLRTALDHDGISPNTLPKEMHLSPLGLLPTRKLRIESTKGDSE